MGRKLGQHFLRSRPVLDGIVQAARPQPGEPVLEVGPGEGVLTERLLDAGVRLTAVEVDEALAEALAARFEGHPGFRLITGDILRTDLHSTHLFGEERPYKVVANLPYYLSTPLLFRLTAARAQLARLVLMVQREVAQRMAASPADGKTYGSLSVVAQYAFTCRLGMRIPPSAFRPPPKVDSALVELEPLPARLHPDGERAYFEHVKGLFTRRRKLLLTAFKGAAEQLPPENWERVEALAGGRRPDALSPDEHLALFRALNPAWAESL